MTVDHDHDPETPPLHSVCTERIPYESWVLAAMATLPPGWVNVRIWSYDRTLGRDLYQVEDCPGILHFESTVTEVVLQDADPNGELFTPYGEPWDHNPLVVDTKTEDTPHHYSQYADPTWAPAYLAGGYLGTCPVENVRQLLAEHGFPHAIPRPEGHVDDEGGE